MNLVYGEIVELFVENGMPMGRVRVAGARNKVPLGLLTEVQPGDTILMCDGVAISKVQADADLSRNYVPRNSR